MKFLSLPKESFFGNKQAFIRRVKGYGSQRIPNWSLDYDPNAFSSPTDDASNRRFS